MALPAEVLELGDWRGRTRRRKARPGLSSTSAAWLALLFPVFSFATATVWGVRSLLPVWQAAWPNAFASSAAEKGAVRPSGSPAVRSDRASAPARVEVPPAGRLPPVFAPPVLFWEADILRWAETFHLDPLLVATVMQIESCGDPVAVSGAGATGLFQVMPYHFAAGENPFDPDTNARRGLAYLAAGLEKAAGNVSLALAGYNGGHGVIGRPESAWPAETRRYVGWGSGIYREAQTGGADSPTLQAWLAAGGQSLCRQASERLGLAGER